MVGGGSGSGAGSSTTSSKPEGTITSLPVKGGKGAPDTFKGNYRDVETFLDHFEALCAERNVIKDEHKCKGFLRYCSTTVRETLEGLKAYTSKNYAEFRKEFIYHYDKDREKQRYKLKDLYALVKKWKERKIKNLETFKKYHLAYLRIGGWLLKNKKIVESEHRRWFWAGLHKRFRGRVNTFMRILDPKLDDSEPFDIEKVVDAAKKVYNRERFDEEEMVLYDKGRGSNSDTSNGSDSDSDSESSGSSESEDSSSSSESSSASEPERKRRKKKDANKRKHASKSKKDKNRKKTSKETAKPGKDQDDEISDLVSKMAKLDVSDSTYLAMWVKLIRKAPELKDYEFLRRPATLANVTVSRTGPAPRARESPPHLNQ